MSLGAKQARFALAISHLIQFAAVRGWRLRFGTAYRDPEHNAAVGGHEKSTHLHRLAVDFMLDVRLDNGDWHWVSEGNAPEWKDLHAYWEMLGGSPMIEHDANHFSFEHGGVRGLVTNAESWP